MTELQESAQELEGSPWWVRATVQLGVPAAIACALVYFLMGSVTASLKAIGEGQAKAETVAEEQAKMATDHYKHDVAVDLQYSQVEKLLVRICLNTAKDAASQDGCFR